MAATAVRLSSALAPTSALHAIVGRWTGEAHTTAAHLAAESRAHLAACMSTSFVCPPAAGPRTGYRCFSLARPAALNVAAPPAPAADAAADAAPPPADAHLVVDPGALEVAALGASYHQLGVSASLVPPAPTLFEGGCIPVADETAPQDCGEWRVRARACSPRPPLSPGACLA